MGSFSGILFAVSILSAVSGIAGAGVTETVLYSFKGGNDGASPRGDLALGAGGAIYGTTYLGGGPANKGSVFRLAAPAAGKMGWMESVLKSLEGNPQSGIIFGPDGIVYGTDPGSYTASRTTGAIFDIFPPWLKGHKQWDAQYIFEFSVGRDGRNPIAPVIADANRNLYGIASAGGSNGAGVIFELKPAKVPGYYSDYNVLFTFPATAGDSTAGLFMDKSGALYGTAQHGQYGHGIVFKLTLPMSGSQWTFNVLYSFKGAGDGGNPCSRLIMDAAGNLYGTTHGGDKGDLGTVFMLSPPPKAGAAWTETVLHRFTGGLDGAYPSGPVLRRSANGALFGTTSWGGAYKLGTVYRLLPPKAAQAVWPKTKLHSFTGGADGATPMGGLVIDDQGNLYGATSAGGTNNQGTVFKVTP